MKILYIFLIFLEIETYKKNKPITENSDLRINFPKVHSLLHDDEISILIMSPWDLPENFLNCQLDYDLTGFFVPRDNYNLFKELILYSVIKADYKKVEFESFKHLERKFWVDKNCKKLTNKDIRKMENIYGEVFVLIPKLWNFDSNSMFYMKKRIEKYKTLKKFQDEL